MVAKWKCLRDCAVVCILCMYHVHVLIMKFVYMFLCFMYFLIIYI